MSYLKKLYQIKGLAINEREYIPEESGHGRTEIRHYQVLNNIKEKRRSKGRMERA